MKKEVLYSLKGIYRENFEIEGYTDLDTARNQPV